MQARHWMQHSPAQPLRSGQTQKDLPDILAHVVQAIQGRPPCCTVQQAQLLLLLLHSGWLAARAGKQMQPEPESRVPQHPVVAAAHSMPFPALIGLFLASHSSLTWMSSRSQRMVQRKCSARTLQP